MSTLTSAGLKKSFESKTVIHNISLEVNSGEIVGLLGPNGAGKTTTFYMIVGLIKSDEGSIHINDQNITYEPIHRRFEQGISYLPQEPSVFRDMTAKDNIEAILEVDKNLTKTQKSDILEHLIDKFDLSKFINTKGIQLSGGERRRVEIARALALKPKFLLLDEPFAGIDPISVIDIQKIIAHLKTKNIGVLITDHNVQETLAITDRTYLMFEGKILKSGKPEELAKDEMVRKVYLGQNFIYRRKDLKFKSID